MVVVVQASLLALAKSIYYLLVIDKELFLQLFYLLLFLETTTAVILSCVVVAMPFSWSWCRCFALANHVKVWKLRLCPSLCDTLLVSIPLRRRTSHRFQTTVSIRHLSCVPFFFSSSYAQGNGRAWYCCKCFDFLYRMFCSHTKCESCIGSSRTQLFLWFLMSIVIDPTDTFLPASKLVKF